MDFTNRGQQTNSNRPSPTFAPPTEHSVEHAPKSRSSKVTFPNHENKWVRWGGGLSILLVAVLIGSALALFFTFKPANEGQYINTDKLQAVFLTNNQVYFGHITSVNSRYLVLSNIYYLQSSTTTAKANNNVSLVKLGCELHKPFDQMVISQTQVSFWENLQADGQVGKAVTQYAKANPSGQKCTTTTSNSTSGNSVQGTSSTDTNNSTSTGSGSSSTGTTTP